MNKTKIILAAIGGVSVVATLVLAWFVLGAMSENTDRRTDTEQAEQAVAKCLGGNVYPSMAGEASVKSNAALYARWSEAAFREVSQYDRTFPETTPAAFKEAMVERARRIGSRPGAAEGRFAPPEFGFGPFDRFIVGKELPSHGALARLQREWDNVAFAAETLADCGAEQLMAVEVAGGSSIAKASGSAQVAAPAKETASKTSKDKGAKDKAKDKKGKAKKPAAEGPKKHPDPMVTRVTLDFLAHPSALVRALDVFSTTNRFIVVEDFSFARPTDELAATLAASGEKKEDAKNAGRRSRRRDTKPKRSKAEELALQEKRKGAVTDPATAMPFKASVTLAFYDFGCPREEKLAEPAEKVAEGDGAGTNAVAQVETKVETAVDAASTNKVEEVAK